MKLSTKFMLTFRRKMFWYMHIFSGAVNNKRGLFKRGITIDIIPTTVCNYHCSYCPMFLHGEVKKFKECTWLEWADFITRRVQHWVSVFYVSGGEPALYKDIVPLINWMIGRGHKVILLTNLSYPEKFEGMKPHWRLMFQPTFHEEFANMEKFQQGLVWLRERGYGITSQVTGDDERPEELKKIGALKRIKEFYTADWFQNHDPNMQAGPDAPLTSRLFIGSANLYRKDDGWDQRL